MPRAMTFSRHPEYLYDKLFKFKIFEVPEYCISFCGVKTGFGYERESVLCIDHNLTL